MTDPADVAAADRLSRRRARVLPVLGVFFITQQIAFFANPPAERTVDHVRIGAWVLMSVVLLIVLQSGGALFRSSAVRALLNDEPTRANRASAMHWGFLAAMAAGIVLYVMQGAAQFTTREAIHVIMTAGIVAALVRFGLLERRSHA